jgi:hypothetical protein
MEKSKKGFLFLIIIIILILLLVIGGLVWYILFSGNHEMTEQESQSGKFAYESSVVVDNPDTLQDVVNGMIQQVEEGSIGLEMKTNAYSNDGVNFSCQIGNAEINRYDLFLVLYRDDTQEEIYRSGLLPVGTHIEQFAVNKPMDEGVYECTLVFNQVEDDQETIHSQVNVELTLTVGEKIQ